jgi:hypothetical protein
MRQTSRHRHGSRSGLVSAWLQALTPLAQTLLALNLPLALMLRQAKTLQTPAPMALQAEQQDSRPIDRWNYRFRRMQRGTPSTTLRLLLSIWRPVELGSGLAHLFEDAIEGCLVQFELRHHRK